MWQLKQAESQTLVIAARHYAFDSQGLSQLARARSCGEPLGEVGEHRRGRYEECKPRVEVISLYGLFVGACVLADVSSLRGSVVGRSTAATAIV